MAAECHVARVALYAQFGPAMTVAPEPVVEPTTGSTVECCEYCESPQLTWRKCKQICLACGQINRSCADL